ncbi:DUF805 domain-containing protein [uncultured Neptuniibacter sp.]|uniref:DUF805 domain-containing protein n=1 Tax=uncultured Neptuniibacter sp. TaxID=502143 RepID=UPI00262EFBCD|nr:DUF805 domain-containing protein [uncultured Neptuniibacter sp.]
MELLLGFGRLNRVRFLAYTNIVFGFLILVVLSITTLFPSGDHTNISLVFGGLGLIIGCKFAVQRYHDVGANGFWSISYLTPGQPLVYLILGSVPGDKAENKYGTPNPENSPLLWFFAIFPLITVTSCILWFQLSL